MLRFSLHCGLIVGILFSQISFAQSAKFTVEGLEHKKARENVSAYLQGLEAPLSGYSRFSQQVSENVIKAMQVYGFYHAEVSVVRDSEDQWQVNITPNEQTLLDQVEITISGPASQQDSLMASSREQLECDVLSINPKGVSKDANQLFDCTRWHSRAWRERVRGHLLACHQAWSRVRKRVERQ